jgi:hypothetical protein
MSAVLSLVDKMTDTFVCFLLLVSLFFLGGTRSGEV